MTKEVFSSISQCCHVWAQQNQYTGRTGNHNVWFEGKTVYSYGRHFPVATFLDENTVLFNDDSYSVSTSNHQNEVHSAVSHKKVLKVPCTELFKAIAGYHTETDGKYRRGRGNYAKQIIKEFIDAQIKKAARSAERRRSELLKKQDFDRVRIYLDQLDQALYAVGLTMPKSIIKKVKEVPHTYKTLLADIDKRAEKERKRKERLARKAQAEREKLIAEALERFFSSTDGKLPDTMSYADEAAIKYGADTLMYISNDGTEIKTTGGAQFPLEHGIKAFKYIRAARNKGVDYNRATHNESGEFKTLRLGHFTIDKISNEGDVTAGCHFIKWQEIERLARILKIYP